MNKNVKRVALGCGVIPIVTILLLVMIVKCNGGSKEEKVVEQKEEKQISYPEKLKSMSREERLKEFANLFIDTKNMGSIWSKENNFCGKVSGETTSPKSNKYTMPSDRYDCRPFYETRTHDKMGNALTGALYYARAGGYTFYNTTLNGYYFTAVDLKKKYFINNEDAVNFFNSIYGEENIKQKFEGIIRTQSRWNFAYEASKWPTVEIAYGCKAYNAESPSGYEVNPNYDNWKSLLKELRPNMSEYLEDFAGWEININDIKDLNRCVVVRIYEEFYKSTDLAKEPETSVTFSVMEVNPKFPYVLK